MKPFSLALLIAFAQLTWIQAQVETFDQILNRAKISNKPILLKFTGSDWCPPCKKLHKEVFATPEFQKFAEKNLIFVVIDFPRNQTLPIEETERNEQLASRFNVRGFPTVILLSPEGRELAREVGYLPGGVSTFLEWIKKNTPTQ
ncbi:MAG: thioredoxin family protein [Chthoniobacterales bacterium]|nr:thioredoxin family protein [Chthoniobacterales bacterium]